MTPDDAVAYVLVKHSQRHAVECCPRGGDLRQHVDAVAILLDHAGHAANLTLGAGEAGEQLVLGGGVTAGSGVGVGVHERDSNVPPGGMYDETVTASTESTHLALEGLHCAGCSTATEKALRALPGVHEVTVDLLSASVEHDPDQTSVAELIAAIEHEGFSAAPL